MIFFFSFQSRDLVDVLCKEFHNMADGFNNVSSLYGIIGFPTACGLYVMRVH